MTFVRFGLVYRQAFAARDEQAGRCQQRSCAANTANQQRAVTEQELRLPPDYVIRAAGAHHDDQTGDRLAADETRNVYSLCLVALHVNVERHYASCDGDSCYCLYL